MNEDQKTYFLGCSTPDGFLTHLKDDISSESYITYIIKGGPGTGKSSMMKKIANELLCYDTPELYYCSSDPGSLDAVLFPKLGVIIVDGTAPHIIEPEYPGVREIIIDLGCCWNIDSLKSNRERIIDTANRNRKYHALAKRYLRAIISLNDDVMSIGEMCINKQKLDSYCDRLSMRLMPKKKEAHINGKISFRQITSVTPDGVITHNNLFGKMSVFKIDDSNYAVTDRLLKRLAQNAQSMGYSVIVSKNIFVSGRVYQHIIIPELQTAFVSSDIEGAARINALRFYDRSVLKDKRRRLNFDRGVAGELINETVDALKSAKDIHDELESYYIKAMNFDKVNYITDELIKRIKENANLK